MDAGKHYTIGGTKVIFPCKAYPTQLCMMDKIMKGLERQQNCLLESPTGSGKSLALLCSCLAWQAAEYEKISEAEKENKEKSVANDDCCGAKKEPEHISPPCEVNKSHLSEAKVAATDAANPVQQQKEQKILSEGSGERNDGKNDEDDDDFCPAQKRFRTPVNNQPTSRVKRRKSEEGVENEAESMECEPPQWNMELTRKESSSSDTSPGGGACCDDKKDLKGSKEYAKVPKIFYGTRTHKQVSQMTRELGKTAYKHVRMCILSSREHSCIHPRVSQNKNKNDECKKLREAKEGESCRYYHKEHLISSQSSIKHFGLVQAWDIEDLVRLGNKVRACPYYAARDLMKDADIIFCPYNYLIDPKIRKQMDIHLKDQIVILDEAHNVEDSARDSASLTLNAIELQEVLDDLSKLVSMGIMTDDHKPLHVMIASILDWMHRSEGDMKGREFEQASKILTGKDIITELEKIGLTAGTIQLYVGHFQSAKDPEKAQEYMYTMTSHSTSVIEGLFLIFRYLFGFERRFVCDYRVAIMKTAVTVRDNVLPGGWRRAGPGTRKEWTFTLNFWCFNPSVVFSEIGAETRSIILTSGTLSPMTSFASELGVAFPIRLEANHVIAGSQVWVGTLSTGPSGKAVNATFRHAETFAFQDEIGGIILRVCQNVPHGVLCFFPSYGMLDKLSKRWHSTGLWSKFLQEKVVVSEPRSGGKSEFDRVMHKFYRAIRVSEGTEEDDKDSDLSDEEDESSSNGALFLAVCRGKVSEGLDFADNNARAVITVGIPFPNTKDIQVDLKRKFNNQYSSQRGLLNGSEWYEIQAFRALNQALGRCIRHKTDWGAIILVDERFSMNQRYTNSISKWVRQRVQHFNHFSTVISSLRSFTDARLADPCPSATSPTSLTQPQTPSTPTAGFSTPCTARQTSTSPVINETAIKQEDRPFSTPVKPNQAVSSSFNARENHPIAMTPVTAQHIRTPLSSGFPPTPHAGNQNVLQPHQLVNTPQPQVMINAGGTPLQFRVPAPNPNIPRPIVLRQQLPSGVTLQSTPLTPQSGTPQRFVLTQTGSGQPPRLLVITSPQGAPVQVLSLAQQGNTPVGGQANVLAQRGHTPVGGHANVLAQQGHTPIGVHANALAQLGHTPVGGHANVLAQQGHIRAGGNTNVIARLCHTPVGGHMNVIAQQGHTPVGGHASVLAQQNHIPAGGHTNVKLNLNVQYGKQTSVAGQANTPTMINHSNQRPSIQDSAHTSSSTVVHPGVARQATNGHSEVPNRTNHALGTSKCGSHKGVTQLRSPETVDREVSTQETEYSTVDRDLTTQETEYSTVDIDLTTQETEYGTVDRDLTTPESSQQSLDNARYQPTVGKQVLQQQIEASTDTCDSEMRDLDCPSTPPLFSASNSPLPLSPFEAKVAERAVGQAQLQTIDNEPSNNGSSKQGPSCKTTVYGVVNHQGSQPPQIDQSQTGSTTRRLFRKTPSKSSSVVFEDPKSPVLKAERDPEKEVIHEKSVTVEEEGGTTKAAPQKEANAAEEKDEMECSVEKTAPRSNLRRAAKNTTWTTRRLSMDDMAGKEERETSLFCSKCESLLVKGIVEQKTIENKQVASLHCEQPTKKRTKKRKRVPSESQEIFVANRCEALGLCAMPVQQEHNGKSSYLNAIYVEEESLVYVPQQCASCHDKPGNPIGVQVMEVGKEQDRKQIWLFCDAVSKKYYNHMVK